MHHRTLGALFLVGCSGGSGTTDTDLPPATDFGDVAVPLDAPCEGIAGLTGQAILDLQTTGSTTTLAYVTADAQVVDPTALTVAITWPSAPEARCYPAWDEAPLYQAPERVGIHGLTLGITTADGHFAESLDATAWLIASQGAPQALVAGVTTYAGLHGDWVAIPRVRRRHRRDDGLPVVPPGGSGGRAARLGGHGRDPRRSDGGRRVRQPVRDRDVAARVDERIRAVSWAS